MPRTICSGVGGLPSWAAIGAIEICAAQESAHCTPGSALATTPSGPPTTSRSSRFAMLMQVAGLSPGTTTPMTSASMLTGQRMPAVIWRDSAAGPARGASAPGPLRGESTVGTSPPMVRFTRWRATEQEVKAKEAMASTRRADTRWNMAVEH
jgi:hypothetical protein